MQRILLALICLLSAGSAPAQVFGGTPPSQKWKQLRSDTARIIFPSEMEPQARRIAAIVHGLASGNPNPLGQRVKPVSIVLQNQTTIPNGYVQMGPYRSEFFMTPPLNNFRLGAISWTDQLALHEYRHVQQFNNFHNGISRLMRTLFGEDGYTLAINASIPDWFYEGDAVYQETVLSRQGRGRLPNFLNRYPALWKAGKNYSWMKLRNGSLKDFVPDHYALGYLLVNYGNRQYGNRFWENVTRDASAFRGLFYPFQHAVKKHSGKDYRTFRKEALASYRETMPAHPAPGDSLFRQRTAYVENYLFPYAIGKDSLLFLRTSYRQRPVFFLRDASGNRRIRAMDISGDNQYSYRNGKIVYAAYESDPRWGWRDYSVIRLLDVTTGAQKTVTRKSKYFTPDINEDGTRIAAVQQDPAGKSEIHLLDAASGEVLQRIHSAEIMVFTDPKFMGGNQLVTAARLSDGRMCLARADLNSGSLVRLTEPVFQAIGYPSVQEGWIYFTASIRGNDDLFSLDTGTGKLYRITRSSLGNYYVNARGNRLTWSAFTADGYQLRSMETDPSRWEEVKPEEWRGDAGPYPVALNEDDGDILQQAGSLDKAQVLPYKKSTRLFNFHSWRPYYSDPVFSFSLYSDNVLNTLQTELYYTYNENERTHGTGFSAVYGAFFPFLNVGSEYTFDRSTVVGNRVRRWDQSDTRIGLSIPLNYAKGLTYRSFNAGSYYVYRQDFNKGFFKDSIGNTSFSYLLHTLSHSQQIEAAPQHIFPQLAYSVSAAYRHAISSVTGSQFIGNGALYLPGFSNNHHLVLTGSFQERDTLSQVIFANRFAYSRGYNGRYFSRMWRLSANYHFPLLHPDWGFGNILYLQRIRANGFYDFTKVYSRDKTVTRDQRSVGGEIFVDTKWWNQYPLSFGFRISRLLDQDQFDGYRGMRYEFILPVSIIPR